MMPLSRRRFLYGLGAAAASGTMLAFARGRFSGTARGPFPFVRRGAALGTSVSITVVHADSSAAETALSACFQTLNDVEDRLSLYRAQSDLCRLNRDFILRDPHEDLVTVLTVAEELSRRTDGAFDVTVQPLWSLFSRSHRAGRTPTAVEIDAARSAVDWRSVEITPRTIRLHGSARGVPPAVTLNGIAQGLAVDRVLETLRSHGIESALIDTGEISGLGRRPDQSAWCAGIRDPRQSDTFTTVAQLDGRCLATSGDYETAFSADFRDHHIFDPRTGRSPTEVASVAVVAPTGLWADGLSTALCVLGPDAGLELLRTVPGADALFVLKDGRTMASAGFPGAT